MKIMRIRSTSQLAGVVLLATSVPLLVVPSVYAGGNDNEMIREGRCSNGADWKIKAKPDDGRLEVEGEIDSSRVAETWRWVLKHNGTVSARGTSTTTARSGSFHVERMTVDLAGVDTFRSRTTRKGAACIGTLSY